MDIKDKISNFKYSELSNWGYWVTFKKDLKNFFSGIIISFGKVVLKFVIKIPKIFIQSSSIFLKEVAEHLLLWTPFNGFSLEKTWVLSLVLSSVYSAKDVQPSP